MRQGTSLCLTFFAGLLILTPSVQSQDNDTQIAFAPPVRITAGDGYLGEKRLYPSPAVFDIDQDGKLDVVIADLWGKITVAQRLVGDDSLKLGPEKKLIGVDGKQLNFGNW